MTWRVCVLVCVLVTCTCFCLPCGSKWFSAANASSMRFHSVCVCTLACVSYKLVWNVAVPDVNMVLMVGLNGRSTRQRPFCMHRLIERCLHHELQKFSWSSTHPKKTNSTGCWCCSFLPALFASVYFNCSNGDNSRRRQMKVPAWAPPPPAAAPVFCPVIICGVCSFSGD